MPYRNSKDLGKVFLKAMRLVVEIASGFPIEFFPRFKLAKCSAICYDLPGQIGESKHQIILLEIIESNTALKGTLRGRLLLQLDIRLVALFSRLSRVSNTEGEKGREIIINHHPLNAENFSDFSSRSVL